MIQETIMIRLTTAALAASLAAGLGTAALAQPVSPHPHMTHMRGHGGFGANVDPSTLPQTKGIIAQFVISPRGDVEALLLADGTEVHVMPQAGAALAAIVKPNDAITIRGLKARSGSMIMAVSIANDATGLVAGGNAMRARMDANGVVKSLLHTPRGDVNGAVLADGTVLRLPPQEAERRAGLLAPGQSVFVRGDSITSPLGKLIMVRQIGPSADKLVDVKPPHVGDHHNRPDRMKP
jgi:hypothetical protein